MHTRCKYQGAILIICLICIPGVNIGSNLDNLSECIPGVNIGSNLDQDLLPECIPGVKEQS